MGVLGTPGRSEAFLKKTRNLVLDGLTNPGVDLLRLPSLCPTRAVKKPLLRSKLGLSLLADGVFLLRMLMRPRRSL